MSNGVELGVGQIDIHRVALLTNPAAGKGSAASAAQKATQRLNERGIDVVHLQGPTAEASQKLAAAAIADDRADALVVCGGDGLINLALQEQAESGVPLGIIPAGTGNDHAREYNIPLDPRKAADVVADGFWTTTDLGVMTKDSGSDSGEKMWFGTIACAGFDSLVSDRTNRMTWPKGRNRYNLAILAEFMNFHSLPARLVLDEGTADERVIEQKVVLVAIGNTRSYGGGMYICPDADHHDGLFDVTVMGNLGRVKAALKFGKVFTGDIKGEDGMHFFQARTVRVDIAAPARAKGPINGYADGDKFAALPMTVTIAPGAGKYLVPRP